MATVVQDPMQQQIMQNWMAAAEIFGGGLGRMVGNYRQKKDIEKLFAGLSGSSQGGYNTWGQFQPGDLAGLEGTFLGPGTPTGSMAHLAPQSSVHGGDWPNEAWMNLMDARPGDTKGWQRIPGGWLDSNTGIRYNRDYTKQLSPDMPSYNGSQFNARNLFDLASQMKTPGYRDMLIGAAMQSLMPQSPLEQAQIGKLQAETQALRTPKPTEQWITRLDKEGNIIQENSLTGELKPVHLPQDSLSNRIASYMKKIPEGSPEWIQMAKLLGTQVNVDMKPAPTEERGALTALYDLEKSLQDAMDVYSPSFTGMIDAPWGRIKEYTGFNLKPDQVSFNQLMSTMIDIAYAKSGKQISEKELEILRNRIPKTGVSDKAFQTQSETFKGLLRSMIKSREDALSESGFKVPRVGANPAPPMPQAQTPASLQARRMESTLKAVRSQNRISEDEYQTALNLFRSNPSLGPTILQRLGINVRLGD